eukprot:SAG22_NODE_655_length_8104_cov_6.498438_11_plen_69_part_00
MRRAEGAEQAAAAAEARCERLADQLEDEQAAVARAEQRADRAGREVGALGRQLEGLHTDLGGVRCVTV